MAYSSWLSELAPNSSGLVVGRTSVQDSGEPGSKAGDAASVKAAGIACTLAAAARERGPDGCADCEYPADALEEPVDLARTVGH